MEGKEGEGDGFRAVAGTGTFWQGERDHQTRESTYTCEPRAEAYKERPKNGGDHDAQKPNAHRKGAGSKAERDRQPLQSTDRREPGAEAYKKRSENSSERGQNAGSVIECHDDAPKHMSAACVRREKVGAKAWWEPRAEVTEG